jgi:hypothetical protein
LHLAEAPACLLQNYLQKDARNIPKTKVGKSFNVIFCRDLTFNKLEGGIPRDAKTCDFM